MNYFDPKDMKATKSKRCKYCKAYISKKDDECPYCEHKTGRGIFKTAAYTMLVSAAVIIAFAIAFAAVGLQAEKKSEPVNNESIKDNSKEKIVTEEHNVNYVIDIEPTCTKYGQEKGICIDCGKEIVRKIPPIAHTPSESVIEVEATLDNKGVIRTRCLVCNNIISEEEYDLSAAEREQLYKADCVKYSYYDIIHSPDDYYGKRAVYKGKVAQVVDEEQQKDGSYKCQMRVYVTAKGYGVWDDAIYVYVIRPKDSKRIVDDDIITFYGELQGLYSYKAVLGNKITIPKFTAYYYE